MEIRPLPRGQYQGYPIHAVYETSQVYGVRLLERGFFLELEQLETPVVKSWEDALFGDWLEAPVAFGGFEGETLLGVVEGSPEDWHNLFRISNLFVAQSARRQGLGKELLHAMVDYAKHEPPTAASFWKPRPATSLPSGSMSPWASGCAAWI